MFGGKAVKRTIGFVLAAVLILQAGVFVFGEETAAVNAEENAAAEYASDDGSFSAYYSKYADYEHPEEILTVKAAANEEFDGEKGTVITEGAAVAMNFTINKSGVYPIAFRYYNSDDSENDYIISFKTDGKLPYDEAEYFTLHRVWQDEASSEYEKDENGNDIRPSQFNVKMWTESYIEDNRGLYELPYFVYLEKGQHTFEIASQNGKFILGSVELGTDASSLKYSEYAANAAEYNGDTVILQAENSYLKSNSSLYPTYDKTNSATVPQDASCVLLNTIGKSNWNRIGDYISWQPPIKSAGWYKIAVRARQNINQGMYSYRTLKINGRIQFDEAQNIAFPFDSDWYIKTLGDNEPYLFYLEPGDTISLTVTMGPISEILRKLNYYTVESNRIYREVISITGTSVDMYRDYMLDSQLPDLEKELASVAENLTGISKDFERITGTKGSQASIIDYVINIFSDFSKDCNEIPGRLSAFQGALGNLGSLISTLAQQPLELDYFVFAGENAEIPKANNNWFTQTFFSLKSFAASFSNDYDIGGKKESEIINVWASVGRDQAKIINNLIRNDFTPKYKTKINFSIVDSSVLIKASLAGKGPDVSLLAGVPLELAARGALVSLSDYDIDSLKGEFNESLWEAMSYNGKIYALPETLTFYAMFYRKDIFEQYGLSVPNTWDDFYKVLEELQKNNLTIGIPEMDKTNYGVSQGISIFNMFLLQKGGTYYNEARNKALFNTESAFEAFEEWVDLHKLYSNNREFDFYSRFRTGEMPLSIQLYSAYDQISSAAPEIQGLWAMVPIPGTAKPDGTVDKIQAGNVTGCYMLKSAVKKGIDKKAFEFMRWWVGSETQTKYGKELEATLGVAARYTPANTVALNNLGWSVAEKGVLNESLKYVITLPQIPGNYLMQRSLTTAFRSAVEGKNRSRRALTIANKEINDELTRKRAEFGLDKEEK